MRELPEPEGSYEDGTDQYGYATYEQFFTHDQVLAIQKHAYEDGLRDAADHADSVGHHWSGATAHAFFGLADSLRAMLTASQERDE